MQKTQERFSVTLRVMRGFSDLPGAPRACMDFRAPTDISRIIGILLGFKRKAISYEFKGCSDPRTNIRIKIESFCHFPSISRWLEPNVGFGSVSVFWPVLSLTAQSASPTSMPTGGEGLSLSL